MLRLHIFSSKLDAFRVNIADFFTNFWQNYYINYNIAPWLLWKLFESRFLYDFSAGIRSDLIRV
jgi:hypothetical protein